MAATREMIDSSWMMFERLKLIQAMTVDQNPEFEKPTLTLFNAWKKLNEVFNSVDRFDSSVLELANEINSLFHSAMNSVDSVDPGTTLQQNRENMKVCLAHIHSTIKATLPWIAKHLQVYSAEVQKSQQQEMRAQFDTDRLNGKFPLLTDPEMKLVRDGKRVNAIKDYRVRAGCSLYEAKNMIEVYESELKLAELQNQPVSVFLNDAKPVFRHSHCQMDSYIGGASDAKDLRADVWWCNKEKKILIRTGDRDRNFDEYSSTVYGTKDEVIVQEAFKRAKALGMID